MERLLSQFIRGTGSDARVDAQAVRKFAYEEKARQLGKTKEQAKAGLEFLNKLISSGGAGIAALTQIEGDYEVLNILRDTIALDIAEVRPLPLGTIPVYRTKVLNPVNVFMGNLTGTGSSHYYITKQAGAQVTPFTFTTERVETPNLNNIYDMERLDLRKDAAERLNHALEIAYNNIVINTALRNTQGVLGDPATAVTAYFAGGGSFAGKSVYSLDPGVVAAGVPSVNIYDKSTEGGLTKAVFQTVNTHSIQIGRNFNKMYIPTAATSGKAPVWESLQNMATPVALITGTGLNNSPAAAVPSEMWSEFQKDDFRGSVVIEWFGQRIEVQKQNWMPAGYVLLFSSDAPACVVWDRLNLEGAPMTGVLSSPVDAFTDSVAKSRNIATLSADYHLRNFLVLKVQS